LHSWTEALIGCGRHVDLKGRTVPQLMPSRKAATHASRKTEGSGRTETFPSGGEFSMDRSARGRLDIDGVDPRRVKTPLENVDSRSHRSVQMFGLFKNAVTAVQSPRT